MSEPRAVTAVIKKGDETLLNIEISGGGPVSKQVESLKVETVNFCNAYMQRNNLSMEDVELVEEDGGDGGGEISPLPSGRSSKGRKRKTPKAS